MAGGHPDHKQGFPDHGERGENADTLVGEDLVSQAVAVKIPCRETAEDISQSGRSRSFPLNDLYEPVPVEIR